jgi:hypothetical protein
MEDKKFIFLAGLHRSGTSLLHEVMRKHPEITGFSGSGVPEDEGQHLQSVYPPAKAFGGPGKFIFDKRSYMDESHPLATPENAKLVFEQWQDHIDLSCQHIIEKSPPNIVRMRFFQKLFPNRKFIAILRHPLAVSYATKKWSKTSIASLLNHAFLGYETMLKDMEGIDSLYILRYEDFVAEPQKTIDQIFAHLGMESTEVTHQVRTDINDKYFAMWEKDQNNRLKRLFNRIPAEFEQRANQCGYSIENYRELVPAPWLGAHTRLTS